MSISKEDIAKAERQNIAINKALQADKVKNMSVSKEIIKESKEFGEAINRALKAEKERKKNKFTPLTKQQVALVKASKTVDYDKFPI